MGGGEFGIAGDDIERGLGLGGGLFEHSRGLRDRVDRSLLGDDLLLAFGNPLQERRVFASRRGKGRGECLDGLQPLPLLRLDPAAGLLVAGHLGADLSGLRLHLPNSLLPRGYHAGEFGVLLDEGLLPLPTGQIGPGSVELS